MSVAVDGKNFMVKLHDGEIHGVCEKLTTLEKNADEDVQVILTSSRPFMGVSLKDNVK